MKKLHIKRQILKFMTDNKWQIFVVCFSLIAGIAVGSIFSMYISEENSKATEEYINNFVSAYNLQSVDAAEVFKFSAYNNIKVVLFIWLFGLWAGFLPLCVLQIGFKGYKIGFSTALFVHIFGFKGTLLAFLSSMPQLLVVVPALVLYSIFSINFAVSAGKIKSRGSLPKVRNDMYIKNLVCLLIMIAVSLVIALIDGYIMPSVLKPICSFWTNM